MVQKKQVSYSKDWWYFLPNSTELTTPESFSDVIVTVSIDFFMDKCQMNVDKTCFSLIDIVILFFFFSLWIYYITQMDFQMIQP